MFVGSSSDSSESLKPQISEVTLIYPKKFIEHAWCFINRHQEVNSGQEKMCFHKSCLFFIEFYVTNKIGKELMSPLFANKHHLHLRN